MLYMPPVQLTVLHLPREAAAHSLEVEVGGELTLHFLKDGVLCGGLSTTRQRLGGRAGVGGGHAVHVLDAHTKCAHQLVHEVECVRSDHCILD